MVFPFRRLTQKEGDILMAMELKTTGVNGFVKPAELTNMETLLNAVNDELLTGKGLDPLELAPVRGMEGIKEATYPVAGLEVKVAIASGLGNAKKLLEKVKSGEADYHFIEIMGCPGGCINGGGQPYHRGNEELLKRRAEALYAEDAAKPLRKSHENPDIQALYEEFLGEPCGPLSHELLHTRYYDRKPVVEPKK